MRNQPIVQVDVENELMRLVGRLENETEEFESLAVSAAEKEATFKSSWASVYLQASGSIREREARADLAMGDLEHEYKVAEALMKSKRETLLFLRTSIDALRSLNANVRAQV